MARLAGRNISQQKNAPPKLELAILARSFAGGLHGVVLAAAKQEDQAMKIYYAALTMMAASAAAIGTVSSCYAQVVFHEDQSSTYSPGEGQPEADFLQRWNRRHEERREWGQNSDDFGPSDVIRLLVRRGYRVKDVQDVGPRYLVRAWRDGDDLLVSVSRSGEIVGVVHDRG
ncbi:MULTISPECIES: hypothetical protein [unclassified Rhizobium]|uniref:hypothetical protein n=1 Tax=unclassified Rhizobium TaxID=2613769 RepID=UPI001FEDA402|nr:MULTISPECIES: hypothetical protein [unclassified Rhizobium]